MKILETERLLFRRLVMDDLDALYKLYSDPEVRQYYPEGVLNYEETKEELEWFLNGHPKHPELGLWATVHKPSGKFIGRSGLLPWTIEGRHEVEIAYLLDKEFWGQGLASEGALAIRDYALKKLGLPRLVCLIDPKNIASQKVAEKIGMTLEKQVDGIDGDNYPTLIYAINKT